MMLLENWIPGFIPDIVKSGQVLLGIVTGLSIGYARTSPLLKFVRIGFVILLSGLLVGAFSALFIGQSLRIIMLFSFTLFTGGAIAANVTNKYTVYTLTWLSTLVLGISSLPFGGEFPANLSVVSVNIFGLLCILGGTASISHWVIYRQNRFWLKIAIRILGSWLLAISVMILAFHLMDGR